MQRVSPKGIWAEKRKDKNVPFFKKTKQQQQRNTWREKTPHTWARTRVVAPLSDLLSLHVGALQRRGCPSPPPRRHRLLP